MYCDRCGKEIKNGANFCDNCGKCLNEKVGTKKTSDDNYSFWTALGCFFVPLLGLILFICYRTTKPLIAKSAGIGALTMGVCSLLAPILLLWFIPLFAIAI